MADVHLDVVVEQVKALPLAEQRELRKLLDGLLQEQPSATSEDELERNLLKSGLLRAMRAPVTDLTPYRGRRPVTAKSRPLSEVIVEERR